jgi:hypothetical protein
MRTTNSIILLSAFWLSAFWVVTFSQDLCAGEITPLSETNIGTFTPEEFAKLEPFMQDRIHNAAEIKKEREEDLAAKILQEDSYKQYRRDKTRLRIAETGLVGTLVVAGAQAVYNAVNPYVSGLIANNPAVAQNVDSMLSNFPSLPDNPLIAPATAVVVGLITAGAYALNESRKPLVLEQRTLDQITNIKRIKSAANDNRAKALTMSFDVRMVEADDFTLITEFVAKTNTQIAELQEQVQQAIEQDEESQKAQKEKLVILSKKSSDLEHTVNQLHGVANGHKQAVESRQAEQFIAQDLAKRPVEKRKRKKLPAMLASLLGGAGAGAIAKATGASTRGSGISTYSQSSVAIDPMAVLAVCSAGLFGLNSLETNLTDAYHAGLDERLTNETIGLLRKGNQEMDEPTMDMLALHQQETREISQAMDLSAADINDIRAKLTASRTRVSQQASDASQDMAYHEEMLHSATLLLKHHLGKKNDAQQ